MMVSINKAKNSIEIDFEGEKPSEQVRELMKAYGFWFFMKEKKWIHTLAIDAEFFKDFVDKRIAPLAFKKATTASAVDLTAMSEDEKQKLLAALMAAK